jgi:large subunit ribosomal protein L9
MAKTEVILINNVVGLGGESDQVKVSAGYARNYLVPQGLAISLTQSNKRRIEALRKRRSEREATELSSMSELGRSLSKVTLTIAVKTGDDGKMFGSVTTGTVTDALRTQLEVSLDKRKIHLEKPIHTLGEHEVELRLHPEVRSSLKLNVISANPKPKEEASAAAEAPKTEKRSSRQGGKRKDKEAAA